MSPVTAAANVRRPFRFTLDLRSGVPVYRQIFDRVAGGLAAGFLVAGDQLPTVRQVAVDLAINPNTVIRAYRELESHDMIETQQGTGTFVSHQKVQPDGAERRRRLAQLAGESAARAGSDGFSLEELITELQDLQKESGKKKGK